MELKPHPLLITPGSPSKVKAAEGLADGFRISAEENGLLRLFLHHVDSRLHGFVDAGLEGVRWDPAEFLLDIGGVNRVAPVVPRTILDEGDESARIFNAFRRESAFDRITAIGFNTRVWQTVLTKLDGTKHGWAKLRLP